MNGLIKKIIKNEPILSDLKDCYIEFEKNRNDIFYIRIWKNKKSFESNDDTLAISMCSFIEFDNHIRAVSESDFDQNKAVTGFHFGLWTNPESQRKGYATKLYVLAELITNKTIIPSDDRTEWAEYFWDQPNRPFGEILETD